LQNNIVQYIKWLRVVFIKLEDLCMKGIQWTCRCFVGQKGGDCLHRLHEHDHKRL